MLSASLSTRQFCRTSKLSDVRLPVSRREHDYHITRLDAPAGRDDAAAGTVVRVVLACVQSAIARLFAAAKGD